MADGGLCQSISYLVNSVQCDNGSASNAISAQIFKTLPVILPNQSNKEKLEMNDIIKATKVSKYISISSYLLIILSGQMIGLPFFIWLVFTLFDFGNFDQLFAVLAVIGMAINIINRHKKKRLNIILLDLVCFALLISPIVRRMTTVPIEMFNYLAFIIPTTIFLLFYLISIGLSFKTYFKNERTT